MSEDLKTRFQNIVKLYISRPGINDLMSWLETTDFYTAPASTKYHGAYPGGLVEHSLAVFDELWFLTKAYRGREEDGEENSDVLPRWDYNQRYSNETLAIVALFHDLCKVDFYKQDWRNVKTDKGTWEKAPYYTIDEKYPFGGHGSKSVFLASRSIRLTPDEAAAINTHMGPWDQSDYGKCGNTFSQIPLAWLLHVADESATFIRKK